MTSLHGEVPRARPRVALRWACLPSSRVCGVWAQRRRVVVGQPRSPSRRLRRSVAAFQLAGPWGVGSCQVTTREQLRAVGTQRIRSTACPEALSVLGTQVAAVEAHVTHRRTQTRPEKRGFRRGHSGDLAPARA